MITVRELIKYLAQFDGDMKVKIWGNFSPRDIEFVETEEVEIPDSGIREEVVVLE